MARYRVVRDKTQQMIVRALLEVLTLREVAPLFGVSYQRIQQIAGKGFAGPRGNPLKNRVPRWELPDGRDKNHIRALNSLGMTTVEAQRLLGFRYTTNGPRHVGGRAGRMGSRREDWTWRGWKKRLDREVKILIARDALLRGATIKEAAEVSGLPRGSLNVWTGTGRLPRSRYRRGFGRPVLRALEQSDGASTEEKPR